MTIRSLALSSLGGSINLSISSLYWAYLINILGLSPCHSLSLPLPSLLSHRSICSLFSKKTAGGRNNLISINSLNPFSNTHTM